MSFVECWYFVEPQGLAGKRLPMTSSIPPPHFEKDDQVQLRSDRSKVGIVIRSPNLRNGAYWYRIRLHAGGLIVAHERILHPSKPISHPTNSSSRAPSATRMISCDS